MFVLNRTDKDVTNEVVRDGIVVLNLDDTTSVGTIDVAAGTSTFPIQYQYKTLQIYPNNVDYTFRLKGKPDPEGNLEIIEEEGVTGNNPIFKYNDLANFYRFPTQIEITKSTAGDVKFVVYLGVCERIRD